MKYMRINRLKRLARHTADILGYEVRRFGDWEFYRGTEWFSADVIPKHPIMENASYELAFYIVGYQKGYSVRTKLKTYECNDDGEYIMEEKLISLNYYDNDFHPLPREITGEYGPEYMPSLDFSALEKYPEQKLKSRSEHKEEMIRVL